MTTITVQTYRFKFSNELLDEMTYFAKVHQYDDRKTFKEEWTKWILEDNISKLIETEQTYLEKAGYDGDVRNKMFKSARYYFRKKPSTNQVDDNTQKMKRKDYTGLSKAIMKVMDNHIMEQTKTNYVKKTDSDNILIDISPSDAYNHFCQTHTAEIKTEIEQIIHTQTIQPNELSDKFKKTYKNRYYIILRQRKITGIA